MIMAYAPQMMVSCRIISHGMCTMINVNTDQQ